MTPSTSQKLGNPFAFQYIIRNNMFFYFCYNEGNLTKYTYGVTHIKDLIQYAENYEFLGSDDSYYSLESTSKENEEFLWFEEHDTRGALIGDLKLVHSCYNINFKEPMIEYVVNDALKKFPEEFL